MRVRGIGIFHRLCYIIDNEYEKQNSPDLGSGLGFISLYILFEKDS